MRLLVFGGLGDHDQLMQLALPLWRLRGFEPAYLPLWWRLNDDMFDKRLSDVLAYVDQLPRGEQVAIIGASAGGVVATLLLLLRPERVWRVVAIASPLTRVQHSTNKLLNAALARLRQHVSKADPELLKRIGSFRGSADAIVRPTFSVLPGAANHQLPTQGHVWTIAAALTLYSGRLAKFLG